MTALYIERISQQAKIPKRVTELSPGLDIYACFHEPTVTCFGNHRPYQVQIMNKSVVIKPGERVMIPTGLRMRVNLGWVIKFYPIIELSLKKGLLLINPLGESSYNDEYFILFANTSSQLQKIEHGDKICQIMIENNYNIQVVS